MNSWIQIDPNSDFSVYNLPFGSFSTPNRDRRLGVAIGNQIIDLKVCVENGLFQNLGFDDAVLSAPILNPFLQAGKSAWTAARKNLISLVGMDDNRLKDIADQALVNMSEAQLHMPCEVGDYTDFYSSMEHATNIGKMFRDPSNPLLPNWKHLPVGYHGRASSICISGTDIHRPKGQFVPMGEEVPVYGPSRGMDFELEVAFITGGPTQMGEQISTAKAEDFIFGFVLFNDWTARDIQRWEYVPLGPFLGKNFGSVISPWVVMLEALEPFRVAGPTQDPKVLPYLEFTGNKSFDLNLEVYVESPTGANDRICKSNFKYMYWNVAQQLAHHTVNGCNIRPGDMMASGTISGSTPDSFGSMIELTVGGKQPITLSDGTERKYLQDGDSIVMKAYAENNGIRIGFGESRSKILPAI